MTNLRLDYLEFNVSSIERSKAFYGEAFGWTFTDYGPQYCEFDDGVMKGGFTTMGIPNPGGPLVILKSENLEDALRRVESAGGKIVKPIFSFPEGRRFQFTDPDGYELGVWSEA